MTTVHRFERAEAKGIKLNFIEYNVNCNADSKKVVLQTCVTSMVKETIQCTFTTTSTYMGQCRMRPRPSIGLTKLL